MKKIYSSIDGKCRNFKNPKISHIFKETLVIFIICSKFGSEDERYMKKKNSWFN